MDQNQLINDGFTKLHLKSHNVYEFTTCQILVINLNKKKKEALITFFSDPMEKKT